MDVQPNGQSHAAYSMPDLILFLERLPEESQPTFIRGDCEKGTDRPGARTGCLDTVQPGMGVERKQSTISCLEKRTIFPAVNLNSIYCNSSFPQLFDWFVTKIIPHQKKTYRNNNNRRYTINQDPSINLDSLCQSTIIWICYETQPI